MSDPRPLAARIEAALTDSVIAQVFNSVHGWRNSPFDDSRAVLTSALLAALEEHVIHVKSHHLPDMGNMIEPAEGPTPAPGDVETFREMLRQSGDDRVRASLILKTFDDLFLEDTPHGVHVDSEPSDPVRED